MMNKYAIRTSETDSVKGLASDQNVNIELKQTTKTLPLPNISTILSQRNVYEEERQAGNKFRLILTVVPYCSNVLFNPLTEIIKNEGSESYEGDSDDRLSVITDLTNMENIPLPITTKEEINGTYGISTPTRVHMISNSEYSSSLHGGYEYHPGYDFFDNHLLRNQSFKLVNPITSNTNGIDKTTLEKVFNTLNDYTRDRNGELKKYNKRLSINGVNSSQGFNYNKHLYLADDILSIDESINQNLYEENGWWGFTNNTTIESKELSHRKWANTDIGKALNNHKACEFIDMYPDRTLFSFAPKFNKFTNKNENNWNIAITYPYKNIYNHPICLGGISYIKRTLNDTGETVEETVSEGNKWMGLKVLNVYVSEGRENGNTTVFRTYTKHGLEQGDMFYLYYTNPYKEEADYADSEKFNSRSLNGGEVYYESESYYKVLNVGDLSKNNVNNFFYVSDNGLIKEIYKSYLKYAEKLIKNGKEEDIPFKDLYDADDKKDIKDENGDLKTELLSKIFKNSNFRIRRCVKGVKSTYYLRQFRKLPNFRAAQREMTEEEAMHTAKYNGLFENYISENALDPTNPNFQRTFNCESYQLGFAANVYNDNVAQFVFTDGIDIANLTDNLGRPLTEIYYTIIKNNAGNEVWYDSEEPIYSNKELRKKYKDNPLGFKERYGVDYDGYQIEFSHCFGKVTSGLEMYSMKEDTENSVGPKDYWKKLSSVGHITNIVNDGNNGGTFPIKKDEVSVPLDEDVRFTNTFFYGDLVEFNAMDFTEREISKVMHRFNTAQRETINNPFYSQYQYHEITEDDYDPFDFEVTEYSAVNGLSDGEDKSPMTTNFNSRRTDYGTIGRPEGYYYQAHYPIKLREYNSIIQDSHYTLRVRKAKPIQNNGILIQVRTYISHGLSENDIIFVCDDINDIRYITKCVKVIDKVTFLMSPNYTEFVYNATDFESQEIVTNLKEGVYTTEDINDNPDRNFNKYIKRYSWLELCHILNGDLSNDITYPNLVLRRKNKNIPDYASYIGGNRYVWRSLLNIGDNRATTLDDFIFANGYFYVPQRINFYLRRQDPFGNNGLYFDGENKYPYFPNDPSGSVQEVNNYITKDTSVSC